MIKKVLIDYVFMDLRTCYRRRMVHSNAVYVIETYMYFLMFFFFLFTT